MYIKINMSYTLNHICNYVMKVQSKHCFAYFPNKVLVSKDSIDMKTPTQL